MKPGRTTFFLSCLFLSACGNGPPVESPPPVVLASAGPQAPPLELAGAGDGPAEDPENGASAALSADACIQKMREAQPTPTNAPEALLYAEALHAERAGELDSARKRYLQVIMKYPQSPLVPLTYFAFGELFLRESEKDRSKIELAEQSYIEVLKYPLPQNAALSAAHFRLADVYRTKGDGVRGLSELKKVLDLHATQPKASCSASLAPPARGMLVATYVDVGRPGVAYGFFQRSSGDRTGENAHALSMVVALAELYVQKNKPSEAAEALLSAKAERYGESFCQRERLVVAKISGAAAPTIARETSEVHARRCDPH